MAHMGEPEAEGRAIQQRVCCSQVFRRLRETGCSPRRPIRYAHHCLALPDLPDAHGWLSLSRQTSAPSAPLWAAGGACTSTTDRASVLQRMASPVPALPARVTCIRPCYRGTSTRRLGRPAGAGGGGARGEGSGRGWGLGAAPRQHRQQPSRRGGETLAPDPPPLYRDAPSFGERRRGPSPPPPFTRPRGTATPERC